MREKLRLPFLLPALFTTLAVAGCASTLPPRDVESVVELPDRYGSTPVPAAPRDGWCSDFGAPELAALVERAFADNLDLRGAWARVRQARAVERRVGASRWPTVDADAAASRSRSLGVPGLPTPGGGADGGAGDDTATITTTRYRLGVSAAYEVDVWNRLANQRQAARLDAAAARADAEAFAVALSARVALAWLELVAERRRLDLLEEQVETSERFLELTRLRLGQGAGTALDVVQQEQQLESVRGRMALARDAAAAAAHRLAVLVGAPPGNDVARADGPLPGLPATPDPGVPADLLTRRPDVRAAGLRLAAADHRTAAAIADRLPAVRLSAELFTEARSLTALLDQLLWSVAGSALQPLFDGGRRAAEVDRAEAAVDAALQGYGATLLVALREVRDALVAEREVAAFAQSLERQLAAARTGLTLARERYRRGATDYLRVLLALRSVQELEQQLLDARQRRLGARVDLCRALGGDWTRRLEPPGGAGEPRKEAER